MDNGCFVKVQLSYIIALLENMLRFRHIHKQAEIKTAFNVFTKKKRTEDEKNKTAEKGNKIHILRNNGMESKCDGLKWAPVKIHICRDNEMFPAPVLKRVHDKNRKWRSWNVNEEDRIQPEWRHIIDSHISHVLGLVKMLKLNTFTNEYVQ